MELEQSVQRLSLREQDEFIESAVDGKQSSVEQENTLPPQALSITPKQAEPCDRLDIAGMFHPEFAKPISSAFVILQSQDDILFYFDTTILIAKSPFFEHLLSLPDTEGTPIIPLPSAPADGLAVVLHMLMLPDERCHGPYQSRPHHILLRDRNILFSILSIADAYDIPSILTSIPTVVIASFVKEPFLRFALHAIADNLGSAQIASSLTLSCSIRDMALDVENLLNTHAPTYLEKLRALHARHPSQARVFKQKLDKGEPILNGRNDFGKNCAGQFTCAGYDMSGGDFAKLRRIAADAVFDDQAMMNNQFHWRYHTLHSVISKVVGCRSCSTRFSRTFQSAATSYTEKYWACRSI